MHLDVLRAWLRLCCVLGMSVCSVYAVRPRSSGQGGKPGGWRAKDLSVDHKPEQENERRRILMCKGRVERTR